MKNSEIMKLSYNHQIPHKKQEIDNLMWYLNEIMKNELHIALGSLNVEEPVAVLLRC